MLTVALAASIGVLPARADAPAAQPTGNGREASLAEYRQHLVELSAIVEACAKARDTKTCDPALVGQDDRVPLTSAPNAERRQVRYDWLRALLAKAQTKDEAPVKAQGKTANKSQNKPEDSPEDKARIKPAIGTEPSPPEEPTRPPKLSTSELLLMAEARLTQDLAQADSAAGGSTAATADHAQERETMKQVLAGRDFRGLEAPTARDSILEKLGDWLNRLFANFAKLQAHAAWVGRAIVWGFILAVCVGLAWGLLQLERRWRIRLVPESTGPDAGAASARD